MFKKVLFLIAVSVLIFSSISFSTDMGDVSGSFTVRAAAKSSYDQTYVVKTVAQLEVGAMAYSVADDMEEGVSYTSGNIHDANVKARLEAKRAEEAEREVGGEAAAGQSQSNGANLSGIEAEILNLINQVRAQHGISQLSMNQSLTDIARARTHCMLSNNYFSHYAPDGSTFFTLLRNNGISHSNAGENLGNATPAGYGSPGAFLNAWMNSPSHRDNMLRSNYRLIGVGVMDSGSRRVVTTIFLN